MLSQILLPLKDSGWHLVSLEYIGHSGVNGTAMQMVLKKIGHGQKVNREQAVSTLEKLKELDLWLRCKLYSVSCNYCI